MTIDGEYVKGNRDNPEYTGMDRIIKLEDTCTYDQAMAMGFAALLSGSLHG
jgi:hypothetical protein